MIAEGYGIFKEESALEYITRWNPNPMANVRGDRTFSYSSFSTYFDCPLRYFWKYVDRKKPIETENSRNALEGGAMHLLLENLVKERPKEIAPWIKERAKGYFEQYIDEMELCKWKSKNDKKKAYEKYLKLVARGSLYVKNRVFNNPSIEKAVAEQKFIINIAPGLTINGLMDLSMVKRGPAAHGIYSQGGMFVEVVDYKGGSSYYVSKEQLQFYGLAGMALFGLPIGNVSFVYPGTNEVKSYSFNDRDYEGLIYKIQMVHEKLKENHRVPASSASQCKWCAFKAECKEKPSE